MSKLAKVEGEVIVRDGNNNALEFYEAEFVLDDSIVDLDQARSLIQNGLLTEKLRKTHENYKRWRTCEVVSFETVATMPENGDLDKVLLEATQLGCVPENIENYRRPDYKLKALQKAIESHKAGMGRKKDNMIEQGYVD